MPLSGLDLQPGILSPLPRPDARQAASEAEAAGAHADREGLRKVARQFEALFYHQLLRSMRETVPDNTFWGESGGSKIYRQLHDQELAGRMADQGGLGIADLIVRQFETSLDREGTAAPHELQPVLQRRGLTTYRQLSGEEGDLVRLRQRALGLGGAVADTLSRYEEPILAAAGAHGLDPAVVLAVVVRESAGDADAVSPRGAQGLMQLMPATARELGVSDPHDPRQNLAAGARYLGQMLDRYGGDLSLALAAYNAGPGNVDRAGGAVPPFRETRDYVDAVQELARELGATVGTNLDGENRERPASITEVR